MRVIISGGGTGGHIYPALAICDEIKKRYENVDILYVGTKRGLESDIVPKKNYKFETIDVKGFNRKLSLDTIKTIFTLFKGISQSKKIINTFKPDVIIGTGGYVCGPILIAGIMKNKKTFIHEQNAFPGMTVSKLASHLTKVFLSFENTVKYFKKKDNLLLTGNPIRDEITLLDKEVCRKELGIDKKFILIVGGSGGALTINNIGKEFIKKYGKEDIRIIHVTGKKYYDGIIGEIEETKMVSIKPYIYDFLKYLKAADLVISRAGALTLAEISALNTPSILIPSPNVTNNHQVFNARVFDDAGAGIMIEEKNITDQTVADIYNILLNDEKLSTMKDNTKLIAKTDAAKRIVDSIENYV